MSLVKAIDEELKQKSSHVEPIEETLALDSVLDHKSITKVDEFEEVTPGELRNKAEVDLGSNYVGKPVSRRNFSKSTLQADADFKKTIKELIGDDEFSAEEIDNIDELRAGYEFNHEDDSLPESDAISEGETSESETSNEFDDLNLADFEEQKHDTLKNGIEIFSAKAQDVNSDLLKGNSIKNQLSIWETLLECRIKMQPCLISANKLYQKDNFDKFKNMLTSVDQSVLSNTYSNLGEMIKTLLELQDTLQTVSSDYTTFMLNKKRKRKINVNDDDTISNSSSITNENEESDKDVNSDKEPQLKKNKFDEGKNLIEDLYNEFKPFGESSINKWYEKTRVASGKISNADFSAFDLSPLKQIEQILFDKSRLIKKTQMIRSNYEVLGKRIIENVKVNKSERSEVFPDNEKKQNEYDEEVFDDDDFYHKLLRDFIERKSSDLTDPLKHGRHWLELQQTRSKMKKKVDTRASKGRKLRYTVHNKLVNFMAPMACSKWTPEAEQKLLNSLFGKTMRIIK